MTAGEIVIVAIVVIASYFFATILTGLRIRDTVEEVLTKTMELSIHTATKLQSSNQREFDLMSEAKRQSSKKYKYFHFMNELLLDIGWRQRGITAESFTVFNAVICGVVCLLLATAVPNLFIMAYIYIVLFILVIAIMFSVSRYGARVRTRRLIAAENLICGNINQGLEGAITANRDLFEDGVREPFERYIDRSQFQNIELTRNIALLNAELGTHSTMLCKRLVIFETERRPGQQDMFRFIMQCNIREEERAAERDLFFNEMNMSYGMCAGILVVFLLLCMGSMPAVVKVYLTLPGKMILAIFFSMIALGFVYVQALQSRPFVYRPERL